MSKKYSIKAGLRSGIYSTIFLIVINLISNNHSTVKEVTITVISALTIGAIAGLITGWGMTLTPKRDFVNSLLNTNEHLLFDTPASYSKGKKAISGILCLTNKRLVYQSSSESMKKYNFSIDLYEIQYAERYKNSDFFRNGLTIQTTQNETEKFVVDMASEWLKMITKSTSNLAQAAYKFMR